MTTPTPPHAIDLPESMVRTIVAARLTPETPIRLHVYPAAQRIFTHQVAVDGEVVAAGISWRTALRAKRWTCDDLAGYDHHVCVRPDGHKHECRCWCGHSFTPPFHVEAAHG